MECKAWVDDCATKCLDEEDEQCTEECKNMLEEHKARCFLECSTVTWEYGRWWRGRCPSTGSTAHTGTLPTASTGYPSQIDP